MASKILMNSRAGNLFATFAMCFKKVDKKYMYKTFLKSDGKPGKDGTTVHKVLCVINFLPLLEPPTRCKSMYKTLHLKQTFLTLGGRVRCLQCQAKSKRTQQQCRAPAAKGKTKCRFHGWASTGPKTPEDRQRCAEAKTIHGTETRKARTDRAEAMCRLRALEDLGHALGIMHGPRMRGRRPL